MGKGQYQIKNQSKKGGEIFNSTKKEIRLCFQASNGSENVRCVCFTKLAKTLLKDNAEDFVFQDVYQQKQMLRDILYEKKLLTIRNQGEDFLLIDVETFTTVQDDE